MEEAHNPKRPRGGGSRDRTGMGEAAQSDRPFDCKMYGFSEKLSDTLGAEFDAIGCEGMDCAKMPVSSFECLVWDCKLRTMGSKIVHFNVF